MKGKGEIVLVKAGLKNLMGIYLDYIIYIEIIVDSFAKHKFMNFMIDGISLSHILSSQINI